MRFDAIGMFWEDRPAKAKGDAVRPMPPIPETGWTPPSEFPNLDSASAISLDTETYDPELKTAGPGWGRGRGHIVGVSLGVPSGHSWYFPIRHEVEREWNLDPNKTLDYLRHTLGRAVPKIGANLIYDIGWLAQEGVDVGGRLYDIQFAEALLDSETPNVSLDALAAKYLGMGKETSILYQWCADFYGGNATDIQRKNIYRSPPRLAGPYAEADASLPMRIMEKQWPLMDQRGVLDVFDMECRLIPLLVKMRMKGAPVDLNKAEQVYDQFTADIEGIKKRIKDLVGFEVNPAASSSMQKAFDHLGLKYGTTAQGNPSFPARLLETTDHDLCRYILEMKRKDKIRGTFIKGYILDKQVNGRLHCSFHPLKSDENGARSGRFASSDPNLQNIPVRTAEGKLVRDMFVATNGGRWRKYDYSQIEYRLLAHHAVGPGSVGLRQRYVNDPDTDYHEAAIALLHEITGLEVERRSAKTINFGLIYGMSRRELIRRIGDGGDEVYKAYHKAMPFAKATADHWSQQAARDGYVTTLLGRKSDFPMWVPASFDPDAKPLPFDEALMTYGKITRAFVHKALNRVLQGGAADIMKAAMVRLLEDGVFDATGIPLLTVHDELDFDDQGAPAEAWAELAHVMENCVQTSVPIKVDGSVGPTWGKAD